MGEKIILGGVLVVVLAIALPTLNAAAAGDEQVVAGKVVKKKTSNPKKTVPTKAIMVLDASGSMWEQIKGKAKITIAREVIENLVKTIDPSINLGLTVYGHRRKGDCRDIEHVLPIAPINPRQFNESVRALQPKGRTPLTEAVRQAAGKLRYTEDKATVILISDGKETCNADPCALGRALAKNGADFTVHVVGFNVPKKDRPGLKCLADATGGEFLTADDAASLSSTLGAVVRKVTDGRKPINTRITLIPKAGSKPFKKINWVIIYPVDAKGKASSKPMAIGYSKNPSDFILPAGRYLAVARVGKRRTRAEFEVKAAGSVDLTIVVQGK